MSNIRYLTIMFLFAFAAAPAVAVEFPAEHPNDLKKAKSKGLQQLTAEELKAFIPGTIEAMRRDKKVKLKIFKPDGVFVVQSFNTKTGTWRLDTSTSTWCRSIYKKRLGGCLNSATLHLKPPMVFTILTLTSPTTSTGLRGAPSQSKHDPDQRCCPQLKGAEG